MKKKLFLLFTTCLCLLGCSNSGKEMYPDIRTYAEEIALKGANGVFIKTEYEYIADHSYIIHISNDMLDNHKEGDKLTIEYKNYGEDGNGYIFKHWGW